MVSRQRTPVVIWSRSRCLRAAPSVWGVGSVLLSTGMAASAKATVSRVAAKRAAGPAMNGEWKAPLTARGMARLHVSAPLTWATASGVPESTTWALLLSLAITTPSWPATRASSSARSKPITAVIAPPPASAIRALRAWISPRPVVKSNTPAA